MPRYERAPVVFRCWRVAPLILCAMVSTAAFGQVNINLPWVRATTGVQKSAAVYMKLEAHVTGRVALVGASSPLSQSIEIRVPGKAKNGLSHSTATRIDVAAGSSVLLKPGAAHLMLVGLEQALKKGARVPLTLEFETQEQRGFSVDISAEVVSANAHSALDHHH